MNPERKILVDLKSCKDASQEAFEKSAFKLRYHVQAAFYLDILRYDQFIFIAVEKKTKAIGYPHRVEVYVASHDDKWIEKGGARIFKKGMLKAGRDEYIKNLMTLKKCRESNKWPGYPEEIQEIGLPKWA